MSERLRLYLVRHGETDLNKDGRFRGHADAPLNEQGKLQAAGAARVLSRVGVSNIYTSPIRRAVETATAIAVNTGARMETDEDFTDIDYGQWQGQTVEEVRGQHPDLLESWNLDPGGFSFPGGDSMLSVIERLGPAFDRLAGSPPEGAVAVVSHLAVLKLSFVVLMRLDPAYFWDVELDNGSISSFTRSPRSEWVLERWNEPPF
jgi:broad specificity phosphatase PhoE